MNNFTNDVSFLRNSRQFPPDLIQLSIQVNRSYIDIATAVNSRIIGIFTTNYSAVTGESWFISNNQRQQSLRKVFQFTNTSSIPHEITVISPSQFVRCWGSFTDGTNSYGLMWSSNVAIAGQISFYISNSDIVFLSGAGAPTLISGVIVLEYLTSL